MIQSVNDNNMRPGLCSSRCKGKKINSKQNIGFMQERKRGTLGTERSLNGK